MRKLILPVFLALALICSCSTDKKEKAADLIQKAEALWKDGRYTDPQKAVEYLDQLIELIPRNPRLFIKRGTAYYNMGQFQKAIENYSEAIKLSPTFPVPYYNRGNAYANLRQFPQAIEDYNQVIRLTPKFAEVYKNRGVVYLHQGNNKAGCGDLQQACSMGDCQLLNAAKGQKLCP
ncbi:MAG TPA: tetratricopeptide repeat protein [Smithella sp.]|nr:tetratricopeptide repeat protein [Smithella sp.]HRS98011.1 tetratricopeptide repeat protein [Smithella sp.]